MTLGYAIKRALDYGLAAGGLLACAPAMAVLAAAIALDSRGGVFYRQDRLGRGGRPFRLLKFRTMRDAPIRFHADGSTRIDPGDDRVTRVGRWLRGGADELPQLVNVLRGEMSLVGPRPDMVSQRALYTGQDELKLAALPGLTSLAVVLGRNDIPWKQRVAMDIRYIERWTLWLDLRILVMTLAMPLGLRVFAFSDVLDGLDLAPAPDASAAPDATAAPDGSAPRARGA
ncbi:MAG TPA: sugar transferase [Kofleriaceae bacterium]|jgi:lipopolysaccharide/colanic/teichoic acid biosynthesis glycosyltransferase|nr:sugar transferase [Kofleriaceae bacterium]